MQTKISYHCAKQGFSTNSRQAYIRAVKKQAYF